MFVNSKTEIPIKTELIYLTKQKIMYIILKIFKEEKMNAHIDIGTKDKKHTYYGIISVRCVFVIFNSLLKLLFNAKRKYFFHLFDVTLLRIIFAFIKIVCRIFYKLLRR